MVPSARQPARLPMNGGLRMLRTPSRLAESFWMGALPINHRFDKLGHALPLELHGCGCGLCARQQRLQRKFWEAR